MPMPRPSCRYSGRYRIVENSAAPKHSTTASERAMAGMRKQSKRDHRDRGDGAPMPRASPNAAAAIAASVAIGHETHAKRCPPDESTNSRAAVPVHEQQRADQVGPERPTRGGAGMCGTRSASAAARMPSGTLIEEDRAPAQMLGEDSAPSTGPEVLASANTVAK